VGVLIFAALCFSSRHAPLLALLAYAITLVPARLLAFDPALVFGALINAIFTMVGLGIGWYTPSLKAYARAAAGGVLCVFLTLGLAEPLGRINLLPLSIPFNLSIFAVLMVSRRRAELLQPSTTQQIALEAAREPGQVDSPRT
jgi:urea transporter